MDEADVVRLLQRLPGVVVLRAGRDNGAPEIAWGDTFVSYDPDGEGGAVQQPFATVVTKDYPGDTSSDLDRPGVFRVNAAVGRTAFEALFGHGPAADGQATDDAALDRFLPHPVYGRQGWVCVLNPGERTQSQLEVLLLDAYTRAVERHRRRRAAGPSRG